MPIGDNELIVIGKVEVEAEAETDVIGLEDDPEIIEEIDPEIIEEIDLVIDLDLVIEEEKNPEIKEDIEEEG